MRDVTSKGLSILGLAATAVVCSAPALATTPVPIPEPSSMGLLVSAVAGAAIAYRFLRRK
jgi:hypothetical protein